MKDKELAVERVLLYRGAQGPVDFNVMVLARPGKDLKEVEKAVYAELDKAKAEPIPTGNSKRSA